MKEILTKKDNIGFTQIANSVLVAKGLSLKAKGLFGYLYSKPNEWKFSADRISMECSDGLDSVKSGLQELEEFGLLTRNRQKDGRMAYQISWKPKAGFPSMGISLNGKSPRISNKEDTSNKKEYKEAEQSSAPTDVQGEPVSIEKFFENKKGRAEHADDGVSMSLKDFVLMCRGSMHRFVRLIGEYADDRRPSCSTRAQWREFGRRNFKVARRLAPYTDRQLENAMTKMEKDFKTNGGFITKWGLETLEKYLEMV